MSGGGTSLRLLSHRAMFPQPVAIQLSPGNGSEYGKERQIGWMRGVKETAYRKIKGSLSKTDRIVGRAL